MNNIANAEAGGLDELLGQGAYASPAAQANLAHAVLWQSSELAIKALLRIPKSRQKESSFASIRQGPQESYVTFIDRLFSYSCAKYTVYGPLPEGLFGLLISRSSATKSGLIIYVGVIDSDYFGEIKVMVSTNTPPCFISKPEKIAQLLLLPSLFWQQKTQSEELVGSAAPMLSMFTGSSKLQVKSAY
uniref:dUTPase-like domain-containing protein n=1 Tax=Serinus canaria TaxID=9135 RepID=A0A8C9MR49_SERCA